MLGILSTLLPVLAPIINKLIPDKAKAAKAKADLEVQLLQHEGTILNALVKSDMAQAEIAKIHAKSEDRFKSYARPAMLWVCVLAFAWTFVIQPAVVFIAILSGVDLPPLPTLDMSVMMTPLLGMLGLTAARTYEKKHKVQDRH